jgi:general secretion pathway protein C
LNTILLAACGWVLATSVQTLLRPAVAPAFELPPAEPAPAADRSFDQYRAVASRKLFRPPPKSVAVAPDPDEELAESKLQVRLIGTAAATDPAFSLAAVEDLRSRDRLVVRANDTLSGARVVRIERKRVVLENRGRLEAITLDEEDTPKARPSTPPRKAVAQRTRGARRAPKRSVTDQVRRLASQANAAAKPVQQRPQSVLTQARIVPRYGDGGELTGLELSAIKPGSLLENAGFQNQDLVVSVNGSRIDDPAQGLKSFRTLGQAQDFVVEVERGGQTVEIEYTQENR